MGEVVLARVWGVPFLMILAYCLQGAAMAVRLPEGEAGRPTSLWRFLTHTLVGGHVCRTYDLFIMVIHGAWPSAHPLMENEGGMVGDWLIHSVLM